MPDGRVKDAALEALLKTHHSDGARVIVFCLYKKEAERVEQTLLRKGWKCVSLHGDKSQAERTKAFNAFRDKECNLLVATDVAARGVDLPNVEHVINYTFPLTIEDYVHRIGRTGRGDSVGNSWTFFTTADKAHAGALVNVLQTAKQEVPKDMFQFSLATKRKGESHATPPPSHLTPHTSHLKRHTFHHAGASRTPCNTRPVDATYGVFGPKDDLQGRTGTKITFDDSD